MIKSASVINKISKSFVGVFLAISTASAAPITFASFAQKTAENAFVWDNNEVDGAGRQSTLTASTQVSFQFLGLGLPAELAGFQDATLTFTASSGASAISIPLPGSSSYILQSVAADTEGTLSITRNTPFFGSTNLLTVVFRNALLSGATYSFSGVVEGSTLSTPADPSLSNVVLTSDFLNFSGIDAGAFALSFASFTPYFGLDGNGMVGDFASAASGVFSSGAIPYSDVPEPASMILIGGGLLALGIFRFRSV